MKCCACCCPFVTVFLCTLYCSLCIELWGAVCSENTYQQMVAAPVREV